MKLSITEGGTEGKSKVVASCRCLEEVGFADRAETLGVDLRTRTEQ